MASILTNTSAMVALQNLRTINSNLVDTQNQIATGKKIATATDNSAIWAVSKVIESDVSAFKAISDSLNLGDSTIGLARSAAETVTDILTELKGNIVAAQEENVDRSKIQADIDAKVQQIESIVDAASFNGLSLVEGTDDVNILGSLVRDGNGNVTSSSIAIARQDLTTSAGAIGSASAANLNNATITGGATAVTDVGNTVDVTFANTWAANDTVSLTIDGFAVSFTAAGSAVADIAAGVAGQINALGLDGVEATNTAGVLEITSTRSFEGLRITTDGGTTAGDGTAAITDDGSNSGLTGTNTATDSTALQRAEEIVFSSNALVTEGDGYGVTVGTSTYNYIAGPNETFEDVARGLKVAIDGAGVEGVTTRVVANDDGTTSLFVDNDGSGSSSLALARTATEDGTASGGLFGLQNIDVTTDAGASSALDNIDTFLNTATDAAASFGSDQSRIDLQAGFISKLTDSLKAGIGSLVDADLEAASARLQALQVQQQLGIQSLSIANQAPQSILSLFR